ncbi:hypothetical protein GF420_02015 [candidate division GN15 bacterium]|nr:hypothetical protein [candidate division GN15 bacterium]
MFQRVILTLLLSVCLLSPAAAQESITEPPPSQTDSIWLPLLEQLRQPRLNTLGLTISDTELRHADFRLALDSGTLYLFEPVWINDSPVYVGGYFVGRGSIDFKPPIRTERFQMKRFYKADSLAGTVSRVVLFFAGLERLNLDGADPHRVGLPTSEDRRFMEYGFRAMTHSSDYHLPFTILRNVVYQRPEPFLIVHSINDQFDHDQYRYQPLAREEVMFGKAYPEWDGVETVCSYHAGVKESLSNINGPREDAFEPIRYTIESALDRSGVLEAEALLDLVVLDPSAQFTILNLHPGLEVSSVGLGDGREVEFVREANELRPSAFLLYLAFPERPRVGDTLQLRVRYHGDIVRRQYGLFLVDASVFWYPTTGASRWTDFDLRFKSPAEFTLIASATLVDSSTVADTLFTHWQTDRPEKGVTFNIADFDKRVYREDNLSRVELYHNRALHEALIKDFREDWYDHLSPSILDPLRLYMHLYGPPIRDCFRASESVYSHGESFPGMINLPFWTFRNRQTQGEDLLMRAHEVAHQWWGSSVGYETYHDQWLSEGLAEFSCLRYCNTVVTPERFVEKLREMRDNVFSVRKNWLIGGEEAGPIIQGRRTTSSKTSGDYQLIIYEKAALVLHMLRCHLTDWSTLDHSRFDDFLKEFHQQYAGRNASTQDFRNLLEKRTGIDWGFFFDQWIYGTELPEYVFERSIDMDASDGLWRARCRVEQREVGPDFTVIMPLQIEFANKSVQYTAQVIRGPETEFVLTFDQEPKKVRLNPFEAVLAKVDQ